MNDAVLNKKKKLNRNICTDSFPPSQIMEIKD